jgi:hypothetical protein
MEMYTSVNDFSVNFYLQNFVLIDDWMHKRGRTEAINEGKIMCGGLSVPQVERNINLVYGGGNIGLMGQVAQMVHNSGGDVVGVIPKALIGPDLAGHTVGESIIVNDMHQRKAEMARRSEAFIALPGFIATKIEQFSSAPLMLQTTCCLSSFAPSSRHTCPILATT